MATANAAKRHHDDAPVHPTVAARLEGRRMLTEALTS